MATPVPGSPISAHALGTAQHWFFWIALGLNAFLWLYVLARVRPQAEPIILHYTLYFGVDRVGEWYRAYLLPFAGTVVVALNQVMAGAYRGREPLVGSLLAGFSSAVQAILWLAALTVVR